MRISATADNCLLTNFPYLVRSPGEYEILADPHKPIRLKELDNEESETSRRAISVGMSRAGSIAKTARSLLGYAPIPLRELERACEGIRAWLNQNVLTSYISKFPQDVIESNGSQLFELIAYLTGKAPTGKFNPNASFSKKLDKVKALYQQYDEIIRSLKVNGALLNNIRPEYLLKSHDYNVYSKANSGITLLPSMVKLSENKFAYLSCDSWITLFYQILKIYYLSRLTPKVFRNTHGMPPEKTTVPENILNDSNFLSVNENLLLKWLEAHYEKMRPGRPRVIKCFDEDLRDGHVLAAVIQSYVGEGTAKSLKLLKPSPQTKEDFMYNAERIMNALEDIGLITMLTAKDLEAPRQREMVIFCYYLYNNLPHYIPKETVEFKCALRDEVIKHIVLNNPSNKPVSYRVRLEGDPDFSLVGSDERDGSVQVPPRHSEPFPVKFSARLSKPMTGRIFFTNKKEDNGTPAAALVFDLVSKVSERKSELQEVFESKLYESKNWDIKVENIFGSRADFIVELVHVRQHGKDDEEGKKKKKKQSQFGVKAKVPPPAGPASASPDDKDDLYLAPFSVKHTTLTIPKGGFEKLNVTFLPFTMDTHICHIIFRDDKVGEMQYTLQGNVTLPVPIEVTSQPQLFFLESEMNVSVTAQATNPNLTTARWKHLERTLAIHKPREQEKEKALREMEKAMETITFDVESLSQFLVVPPVVTINNTVKPKGKDDKKTPGIGQSTLGSGIGKKKHDVSFDSKNTDLMSSAISPKMDNVNKISMALNFKVPTKDHALRFLMKSQNKLDVRLYEFKATVLPKPVKATLEMRCPARELLIQDIPFKNDTDRDWNIRAIFTPDVLKNGSWFSAGKDFRILRNTIGNYQIQFRPAWINEAEAKLALNNPFTGQQYEFELRGYGEEPLAEGHVVLECKARKTKSCTFSIKNEYERKMTYRVETDLYNASGASSFELGPGKTEEYNLDVTPVLGGAYTGSITFKDEEDRYRWWTVEVHTESPKAEKIIDLATTIRKAIAFEIVIANPLDERVVFEVILNGEGLIGDNAFVINPKQTATYELVYSPLRVAKQTGSIAFIHEKLGEVWYDLNLEASEPAPVKLSLLQAELGKVGVHTVGLENPSNKEVRVKARLSNPYNFDVLPDEIVIAPYDSASAQIRYMPSDLEINDVSLFSYYY